MTVFFFSLSLNSFSLHVMVIKKNYVSMPDDAIFRLMKNHVKIKGHNNHFFLTETSLNVVTGYNLLKPSDND